MLDEQRVRIVAERTGQSALFDQCLECAGAMVDAQLTGHFRDPRSHQIGLTFKARPQFEGDTGRTGKKTEVADAFGNIGNALQEFVREFIRYGNAKLSDRVHFGA